MKKLGVISSLTLSAVLAIAAIPAGAQTTAGTTNASVPATDAAPLSTPAPASVTNNLNLIPSLAPTPAAAPAAASSSSDSFHRFDFFAGYSFLSNEIATVDDGAFTQLNHGYAASVTFNLNRNFGILADFSGHNGSANGFAEDSATHQTEDQYYFLFGPVVSHTFGKARISGHVTVGIARQHYGENFGSESESNFQVKENDFAVGAGGAFDWMFTDRWGWRVLQVDYLMSDFTFERVNNFRGSTGLLFRF
ncbi:MAG TPA: hypothetical protein VIH72_13280 [Candidatus Acidoferrales bacterium]|jgi:hypothetical protein